MDPTVSFQKIENDILYFNINNCNVSIVNSIRRTLLSDIETLVFRTSPESENRCLIKDNLSRLHNEIIKQRLSCVPIHVSDIDDFNYKNFRLDLNVENETNDILLVTTKDFKIYDKVNEKYLSSDETKEIFPPFVASSGEHYIELLRLRPETGNKVKEKINLSCEFDIGTAKENGSFNVVSTCAYGFTEDKKMIEEELQKLKVTWSNENKNIEDEETNWKLLTGQRFFKPDHYDFSLKSIGVFNEHELLIIACETLIKKLDQLSTDIETNVATIQDSNNVLPNSYDFHLDEKYGDYTLGKIIEYVIFEKYYNGVKNLNFCGFSKLHPHDTTSIVRIAFKENVNVDSVRNIIKESIEILKTVFKKLKSEFDKLKKVK